MRCLIIERENEREPESRTALWGNRASYVLPPLVRRRRRRCSPAEIRRYTALNRLHQLSVNIVTWFVKHLIIINHPLWFLLNSRVCCSLCFHCILRRKPNILYTNLFCVESLRCYECAKHLEKNNVFSIAAVVVLHRVFIVVSVNGENLVVVVFNIIICLCQHNFCFCFCFRLFSGFLCIWLDC